MIIRRPCIVQFIKMKICVLFTVYIYNYITLKFLKYSTQNQFPSPDWIPGLRRVSLTLLLLGLNRGWSKGETTRFRQARRVSQQLLYKHRVELVLSSTNGAWYQGILAIILRSQQLQNNGVLGYSTIWKIFASQDSWPNTRGLEIPNEASEGES